MTSVPRVIHLVHEIPGRLRLRLSWLRSHPEVATPLADHLAALRGMVEVSVRPYTGSVVCCFDAAQLESRQIVAAVRRHTGVALVLGPQDEDPHPSSAIAGQAEPRRSSVAHALVEAVRGINSDVMRGSDGRMDLPTLASLGFLGLGALEIAVTRQVPAPPWFNLAWWAIRTLTTFESDAMSAPAQPPRVRAARRRGPPRLHAVRKPRSAPA